MVVGYNHNAFSQINFDIIVQVTANKGTKAHYPIP